MKDADLNKSTDHPHTPHTSLFVSHVPSLSRPLSLSLCRYSFLLEAIDKLIAARRILQWTYSLAYYLRNGGQKHLFEYQQEMLAGNTEALQDVMERNSLEQLLGLRKDIINKTSSMDKFRQEMVAQVERGEFDELLLSHADIGMDSWTCVNCKVTQHTPTRYSTPALPAADSSIPSSNLISDPSSPLLPLLCCAV
jgi:hypothetical protein